MRSPRTEHPTGSRAPLRIGVLGGTFDPPHVGHAIVAQDLVVGLDLDRLLVVPAAEPPHREVVFPAAARLGWAQRLFRDADRIEVSDLEHQRTGPSFTIDTLRELRARHPEAELTLIMGADQFAALATWKDPQDVARLARIAVMRRAGEEPRLPGGVHGIDYIVVDVTRIDVSASRIRERLREGSSIRYLVPDSIRRDIERAWAAITAPARSEPA